MPKNREQASALLKKSSEDYDAAVYLATGPGISFWTVGFHAQQSVEKALKAVLMLEGVPYPFTHDITDLIKILRRGGMSLPPDATDLSYLTPFAALFRYEDEQFDNIVSVEAPQLLDWARSTLVWAQSHFDRG